MEPYAIAKKIEQETGIVFKIFSSMQELRDSGINSFAMVIKNDELYHLTVTKKAQLLETYFEHFSNLLSLECTYSFSKLNGTFLKNFKMLNHISLRRNQLKKIPEWLSTLTNLTSLDLGYNKFTSLPDDFASLTNLTFLDLGSNKLTSLPDSFTSLANLISLDLSNNQLTSLPDSFALLTNLTSLYLQDNQLTSLPDSFTSLINLTYLYLQNNQLTSLPDSFTSLTNLTYLDLRKNQLTSLPDSFASLTNLTYLYLGDNQLTSLLDSFASLTNLTFLDLGSNQLTSLPDSFASHTNLTSLYLQDNQLTSLPDSVASLTNLTYLNLENNPLTSLPDAFASLTNLKFLNLACLKLTHIPKFIVDLNLPFTEEHLFFGDSAICLHDTILTKMDISLFQQTPQVIQQFYNSDLVTLKECKLIILGDGLTGKTCLVERLTEGTFPIEPPRTDGIISKKWAMPFSNGDTVAVKILDFGGQEIMYSMHTCFLTSRTIYLVVLDARQDNMNDTIARNWLENIQTFAPNSPVILVINKVDSGKEGNLHASINGRMLREEYKNLHFDLKVSAYENNGIDQLRNCLEKVIMDSDGYQHYFNEKWLHIKNTIENMTSDYIKDAEYAQLCEQHGISEDYLKESLLKWFKDLGVSYYYKSAGFQPHQEKYRVLNPEWLTNGIYTLILKTPSDTGILEYGTIRKALHENTLNTTPIHYTDEEIEFILYVMRQYEISLEIEGKREFIPSKLSKESTLVAFPKDDALHISWCGKFIPNTILHQLMVRNYKKIMRHCMWRTGAIFSDGNKYKILIEKSDVRMNLYVYSEFEEPRIYLQRYREELNEAMEKMAGIKEYIHYKIDGQAGKEPYERVIKQFVRNPNKEIYLEDIDQDVHPQEILNQNYTEYFIREERKRMMSRFDFTGAAIEGLTILGEGDNFTAKVMNIQKGLNSGQMLELLGGLKGLLDKEMPQPFKEDLQGLVQSLEHSDQSTWKDKVTQFLGNASNVATLSSLGFQVLEFFK